MAGGGGAGGQAEEGKDFLRSNSELISFYFSQHTAGQDKHMAAGTAVGAGEGSAMPGSLHSSPKETNLMVKRHDI